MAPLDHAIASARSMRRSSDGGAERNRDEDEVDVGRDGLAGGGDAGGAAHQHAAPRQQMHRDAVVDDQPVAGGDAAVVGSTGERRRKRHALRPGLGHDGDHASVDADNEAAQAVAGGGVSERRFE